ncbi:MAG: cobyrinate a,c-diamide synthase [Rhodoferax sp.]|nr:cobyrinate a,c-diamide synthase [Rhodoferax sp.]
MSSFLISAAHKSSGKTTISVGLCAALSAQGLLVQPFKKGPDYIDPMWLGQASGRDCFNLDPYLMAPEQITTCYARHAATADICIVEGNKGLYDGLALDGSNSNAALAQLLDLPVVLVLDARGMTRGIAPLILGYQAFDTRIRIVGVILNQLGGARHESKLRAVIEHYTNVPVLGAIAHDPRLALVERHLGLMPNHELDDAAQRVRAMGELIAQQVDLSQLRQVTQGVAPSQVTTASGHVLPLTQPQPQPQASGTEHIRIGVARDKAFGFYYPDDLLALEQSGAALIPVDTLHDTCLPELDGLFIGGGFPEMFMPELQANTALRHSIHAAIESGLPVYAECGGLMYLARTLRWKDQTYDMVGAIPADVVMHERPVGRGYVELQPTGNAPWAALSDPGQATIRGHEFHYSSLENVSPDLQFAYRVLRGHGVDGQRDGIVYRNVVASYAHLRNGAGCLWAEAFSAFVRSKKITRRQGNTIAAQTVQVKGPTVATDVEGYLRNIDDWSEDFARAQAEAENLELTDAHWQVIGFLRAYYEEHRVQAQVRAMIWHFAKAWGPELGNNHHLHTLFPIGGPQKQGNRLAGLLKTKGEH